MQERDRQVIIFFGYALFLIAMFFPLKSTLPPGPDWFIGQLFGSSEDLPYGAFPGILIAIGSTSVFFHGIEKLLTPPGLLTLGQLRICS